jgi:serine/threonine protein phosphatase 1
LAADYVLGDLHCNYKGLMQVLEKVNFNYEKDNLYFIGDLFDGIGKDADKCLLELLKIKNLNPCMGNHDLWVKHWLNKNQKNKTWLKSGGNYTVEKLLNLPYFAVHLTTYFQKVKPWYNYNNYFICHAGFDNRKSAINQKEINFSINRSLFQKAIVCSSQKRLLKFNFNNMDFTFEKVIIGHTPTISGKPEFVSNVINIDTGSANTGKLTLMNLNTLEYYQSDLTKKLYKLL